MIWIIFSRCFYYNFQIRKSCTISKCKIQIMARISWVTQILKCVLPDGLFSLSLTHFGLLVPLSHDILESGSNNGPLELLCPLGTLLWGFFLDTLPVLTSVEHSPSHLTRIPLQQMSFHAAAIQKFEDLAIRLDQSPATARIDLVATVCTEFDPGKDIFG